MANYRAVANGNWSNLATWQDNSSGSFVASTILPTNIDNVFPNGFTVTIDGVFSVSSIQNISTTGIVAGGTFILDNDLTVGSLIVGVGNLLQINKNTGDAYLRGFNLNVVYQAATSPACSHNGLATFNIIANTISNSNPGYPLAQIFLTKTSGGILNVNSNLNWPTGNNQSQLFSISNGNSFFTGNILNISNSNRGPVITQSSGNLTFIGSMVGGSTQMAINFTSPGVLNITGNISGTIGTSIATSTVYVTAASTVNITGNISGGVSSAAGSIGVVSNANINIVGNTTGIGNSPAIINTTTPATIDLLGVTTSGVGYPAVQGLATTFVKVRGNVVNTDTYCAIYAGRVTIDDNVTSWQFKDSTNTVTRTLYTAGVALGNPATNNVRSGVTYGPSLELTGTLVVPNPSNVLLGVPTDNTTGTYSTTPALIATEIFTKLLSSTDFNTSGSFGKLVKDNLDAQVSSRLASSSYVAPNNTDISAIKLKTDNLPIDPASDTQVNTRLAASAYIVPPTVTQIRTEMDTNSTKLDVAVSTRLASSSYVAPDNADIAAIKAVTDTLTDVATETTSLAIKTKTDLIPNNPASVESVGAIVASYNI